MWHVVRAGNTEGPYTEDHLSSMYDDGSITEKNYVWKKGQGDWKPLSDMPDLLARIHGVPPPPTPAPAADAAMSPAAAAVAAALADDEPTAESTTEPAPAPRKKIGLTKRMPTEQAPQETAADPQESTCPKCGGPKPAVSPLCQSCTTASAAADRHKEKNAYANLAAAAVVQKDLTRWGWLLMGFGLFNLLMAFMGEALAGEGFGILIIKIFSGLQIAAGLLTIIIYRRFMYVVIIIMTLLLAGLNAICGAFLLAAIQGFYGFGLIGKFIRTRPKQT